MFSRLSCRLLLQKSRQTEIFDRGFQRARIPLSFKDSRMPLH